MDILDAIGDTSLLRLRRVVPPDSANVIAALAVAERLGPGAKVVTLLADSGLKYLSTDVYRSG